MTSPPPAWSRIVGALGLAWGALEVGALVSSAPDTSWTPDLYSVWLLVLAVAVIGLSLGLPGWLLVSRGRPTRRAALGAAVLTTLGALVLLLVAAVAHSLRNSPSIEMAPDSSGHRVWIAFLVAALVRLPLLAALLASASVRPQATR
ncbi:hypothetical protein [Archangium primigenium]|uniref:hypothetical protein n=1 Tax=[Archangium] primigenium TaxID=2792470 RepID=UPI00195D7988|nr:hypothetical protein [Archangium primigenium]MBM7112739.1 hypothetical protein [Archangium primigenium]